MSRDERSFTTRVSVTGVPLDRRLRSAYARDRLTEATYLVVLDLLHPCAIELSRPAERDWLNHAIERPIRLAVDAALDALGPSLERALEDAPEGFLERLDSASQWRSLGYG
jgi:hypothetical protein